MFKLIIALLVATVCIIFGGVSIISPQTAWEMQERMRYKDSREPSDASLFFIRIEGVAIIALAIFFLMQTWESLGVKTYYQSNSHRSTVASFADLETYDPYISTSGNLIEYDDPTIASGGNLE